MIPDDDASDEDVEALSTPRNAVALSVGGGAHENSSPKRGL